MVKCSIREVELLNDIDKKTFNNIINVKKSKELEKCIFRYTGDVTYE
mgnify:CR=1 FL=1